MNVRPYFSLTSSFAGLAGIALLAAAVATAYFGMRAVNETLRVERLAHSQAAGIEALQASLKEVDALQREYLITGEPGLIARFETQREKIRLHLSNMVARFEQPEQQAAMPALMSAVSEQLDTIEQTMQERRRSGADGAARLAFEPARVAVAGRAYELLDQIRKRYQRVVAHREVAAADDLGFLERGMLVGILLAGVLLGWSVRAGFRQEAARQAAETALQARSRELRLLIDAVPAMIAYVDPGERVLLHNRAFAEWLGMPSARIEGRTLRELLGEQEYAAAGPHVARALAGETVQYERQQRLDDGSVRDLAVAYVPHRSPAGGLLGRRRGDVTVTAAAVPERSPAGAVLGYYALHTDITELKNLSRMKSEFVSMVSHEVRTPATVIRGALGMLVGGAVGTLPPEAGRLISIAHASCERLVRLVDDIVDIEKIEAGAIALALRDEDLARLVPLALVAAGPQAAPRGVRLQTRGDSPPARVHTDAGRVIQVLTNFLTNAIQFSPAGGVIQAGIDARGDWFRVSVRDHGPGVSDDMRPRLFEKFSQDPAAARGSTGRFGLGLAISKLLVERLGGRIGYEPAPGGGALFWFELPGVPAARANSGSP
jgi:PAS domain S-box-containing protein